MILNIRMLWHFLGHWSSHKCLICREVADDSWISWVTLAWGLVLLGIVYSVSP